MSLLYKPDWEDTKERYKAWWSHEYFGRCAISVTAPKSGMPEADAPPLPEKVEDRWLDFDYLHDLNEYRLSRTFFGGEALPLWHPGYPGWGFIPVYLGAKITLDEYTGWVDPILDNGELTDYDFRDLVIPPNSRWWQFAQKMVAFSAEESAGKSLAGVQAIGGCGDTLAALRSTNKLLLDIVDCPEYVRDFDQYLMKMWMGVYDTLYQLINQVTEGSTCWFTLWSPGKFYSAHNDFAYMISPQMFEDIFLPSIEMQTQFLDHCVYHVDGIGNFNHVDALLELPRLQAFQVLPGAGKPSPLHYMDLLKKIQKAGKNVHITIDPDEVEMALENLSARGLFINTWSETEEDARVLIANAEKWSVDRR